jgi:hypothetical protein
MTKLSPELETLTEVHFYVPQGASIEEYVHTTTKHISFFKDEVVDILAGMFPTTIRKDANRTPSTEPLPAGKYHVEEMPHEYVRTHPRTLESSNTGNIYLPQHYTLRKLE